MSEKKTGTGGARGGVGKAGNALWLAAMAVGVLTAVLAVGCAICELYGGLM